MKIMTRDEVRAHWLALGYTHVETLAGPIAIEKWLGVHEHGPDTIKYRFEMRENNKAVDGAREETMDVWEKIGSQNFFRGVWTQLRQEEGS
jgi:hypothetical protein